MKIYSKASQLRDALKKIKPSKIAVAFVGSGWKNYVSPIDLKEIILSPTLGSNPKAIEEIMNMVGETNVYFLDNLHSKIYLGAESALLGSSNLSDNGFANWGLLEAGVVLSGQTILKKCNSIFNDYKANADFQYPTTESKEEKLRELTKKWQISIWHGLEKSGDPPVISDPISKLDRIHIAWYSGSGINYNKEIIGAIVPESKGFELDNYFSGGAVMCLEEDSVQPGDWILHWRSRGDGYPHGNGSIYWIHVHHVIPNGVKDDTYTKLVGQAKNLFCPPPPFILDQPTKNIIRETLASGEFPELLSLDDEPWRLAPADDVTPQFLEYLKKQLK